MANSAKEKAKRSGSQKKRKSTAAKKPSASKGSAGAPKRAKSQQGKSPQGNDRQGNGQSAKAAVPDATANAALAGQAALAGTRAAGKAVSLAAARARVPLVAAGGLTAGVVGGLAVVRRRRERTGNGAFDLGTAAGRVGALGEEIGRVAIVVQRAADGSKRSR